MPADWQRRRILIWGKTRPEMSRTYRETVCTGGVFADTKRLVRLYPIPLRLMDDARTFQKYQWIEANVRKTTGRDLRPESYNIQVESITLHECLDTERGTWASRAKWVLQSENLFESVEQLQARQAADRTSLGLVRPQAVEEVFSRRVAKAAKEQLWQRYRETLAQMKLPIADEACTVKPLTPPDFYFYLRFRCEGSACGGHVFKVLDWEVDALYGRQRQIDQRGPDMAAQKVVEKLQECTAENKDFRVFLGNISTHPANFTIVGLWFPKKPKPAPPSLFD